MALNLKSPGAGALLALTVLSWGAVGVALIAQHQFGVKPCPWCVLQRGIYLLIGGFALLGWLAQASRPLRRGALALVLLLCVAGIAAAVYQHEVAAQTESCAMGLADRILGALDLEERWPPVFMVTAGCAEAAAYRLLGLPYEIWSGVLYALLALQALISLRRR